MNIGESSKKMTDIMEKYTVIIISGEIALDVGWTQMNSELNAVGYAKAQQYVKETMDKLKCFYLKGRVGSKLNSPRFCENKLMPRKCNVWENG